MSTGTNEICRYSPADCAWIPVVSHCKADESVEFFTDNGYTEVFDWGDTPIACMADAGPLPSNVRCYVDSTWTCVAELDGDIWAPQVWPTCLLELVAQSYTSFSGWGFGCADGGPPLNADVVRCFDFGGPPTGNCFARVPGTELWERDAMPDCYKRDVYAFHVDAGAYPPTSGRWPMDFCVYDAGPDGG
jgi:hypothetical protein